MESNIMTNLQTLLPIQPQEDVNTVNSRDIHSFLGVGKKYATWITDLIKSYGFEENLDYLVIPNSGKNP